MRIAVVGTGNETKVTATRRAARRIFGADITVVEAPPVITRPREVWETEQIVAGALDLARVAGFQDPTEDFAVGLQNGFEHVGNRLLFKGAVCVLGERGLHGLGFTPGVLLNRAASDRIIGGEDTSSAVAKAYDHNVIGLNGLLHVVGYGKIDPVAFYQGAVEQAFCDHLQQVSPALPEQI